MHLINLYATHNCSESTKRTLRALVLQSFLIKIRHSRLSLLFFFQAEDGIRDVAVTGVQTCALPICLAIENGAIRGAMNVVAPQAVQNTEFTKVLAKTLHRPALFPAPTFALRLALGEMADALLLSSQRVKIGRAHV